MLGTLVEWYDYAFYGAAASLVIGPLFFSELDAAQTVASFATFAVGFIARPLGGLMIAHFGDEHGRKPAMLVTIRRGQRYNVERALSNGHKIFGFVVDQDKRYIPDPETAPIVTQIFHDYASGVSMQKICHQLNAQGIRTTRGYRFTPKNLNKMLKNRAYIGEYAYGGHVHEDGMPRIVDDLTFNEVQRRFAINKRRGAKTKAELATQGENAPDYWLTGRAYCLTCGGLMEGVSDTSKTGKTYRYYYCLNQHKRSAQPRPFARMKSKYGLRRSSPLSSQTLRC